MLTRTLPFRKAAARLSALFAVLWLAACDVQMAGTGPMVDTGRAVPVALLVPRSSPDGGAIISQSLENAARLAIADLQGAQIDLRVYDSGGQPGTATTAAQRAIGDGAQIILGPVFAGEANAAGLAAASSGVNVLAFSNNPEIAGGNVFILGTTFDSVATRLAGYAAGRGRGDIFVVSGQDVAESSGRDAILRAISRTGARLAGQASFPLSQQGVTSSAPAIASQIQGSGANAVFLTSGTAGALPFLADLLPENGVSPATTQYIGLQRLDIPAGALTQSGLQGAWFALPDPQQSEAFRARYQSAYGAAPHPIAGLAYDGIAAIGALVAQGRADALGASALTQGSGFAGSGGTFRLLSNGSVERALAVAEVRNNQVVIIDPAPRRLGGAGF
jgi:hypothetical protein